MSLSDHMMDSIFTSLKHFQRLSYNTIFPTIYMLLFMQIAEVLLHFELYWSCYHVLDVCIINIGAYSDFWTQPLSGYVEKYAWERQELWFLSGFYFVFLTLGKNACPVFLDWSTFESVLDEGALAISF